MQLTKLALGVAAVTLTGALSAAQPATPVACETLAGYDKDYAQHKGNYGAGLIRDEKIGKVHGFYQLGLADNTLYAAFGGVFKWQDEPKKAIKGTTPGILVALDANTMQFKQQTALPFHAHALAVDNQQHKVITTHTHFVAFSVIDPATNKVACYKPDTKLNGQDYRGRYVAVDSNGDIFINYYAMPKQQNHTAVVMKYHNNGQRASEFKSQVFEQQPAVADHSAIIGLPLLVDQAHNERLLVGSTGLKAIDNKTGTVTQLMAPIKGVDFFNYVVTADPNVIIAVGHAGRSDKLRDNIYLLDLKKQKYSSLYTARQSVEAALDINNAKLFTTNFASASISMVDLPAGAENIANKNFVNIVLDGEPSNITARSVGNKSEVFVTNKWVKRQKKPYDVLTKITVDNTQPITAAGACEIVEFDMQSKQTSKPQACKILTKQQSYQHEIELLENEIVTAQQESQTTIKELTELHAKAVLSKEEKAKMGELIKELQYTSKSTTAGLKTIQQLKQLK